MQSYVGLTNVGYEIIEDVRVGKWHYVLGYNPQNQCAPYVTWCATSPDSYHLGHYIATEAAARYDLLERACDEARVRYEMERDAS